MKLNPPTFPDKREAIAADDLLGLPPMEPLSNSVTDDENKRLYHHMANDNSEHDFAMSFAVEGKGPEWCKSKTLPLGVAIDRAVVTNRGKAHPRKRTAFMPYPANRNGETRWGALDFDAHDGNVDRARSLAYKAWLYLREEKPSHCVVIEEDPGGSFHVWIISDRMNSCDVMFGFLLKVAEAIGAEVRPGVCELFPHAAASEGNLLRPLRAPGSLHARHGLCSKIAAANLPQLLAKLPPVPRPSRASCPSTKRYLSSSSVEEQKAKKETRKEGINEFTDADISPDRKYIHEWASRYPIKYKNARNRTLQEFVENGFFQLGRDVSRLIADAQYRCKSVETEADLAEHLRDFESLWNSCIRNLFLPKLTPTELGCYDNLTHQRDRDAYKIIHSFNSLAQERGSRDFPIASASLAKRLGISRQGASKLIHRFMKRNVIERTIDAIPQVEAAHYAWLAGNCPTTIVPGDSAPTVNAPITCDLTGISPRSRTDEEQFVAFGDQILALLALHGPISHVELQRRVVGYAENVELCEAMLRRLRLKLVIDVNAEGDFRLGPERQHFRALVTQHWLKEMVDRVGVADTDQQFETMAHHFRCDVDELKRQRDVLLELGEMMRTESGRLVIRRGDDWPIALPATTEYPG
jgi:hypothetical protein